MKNNIKIGSIIKFTYSEEGKADIQTLGHVVSHRTKEFTNSGKLEPEFITLFSDNEHTTPGRKWSYDLEQSSHTFKIEFIGSIETHPEYTL